jgi:HemY protein
MRWLTWALLLSLLAAAVALVLQINAGNVAFYVPPYRLDVALNLFLLVLTALLLIVYLGGRALQRVVDFPEQVRLYRARREEVGGQQALVEAVRSLLEGRFARAEKAARAAQSSSRTEREPPTGCRNMNGGTTGLRAPRTTPISKPRVL